MKYKRCGECKNFTAHFMTTVCCDCEFMSNFEQKPTMTNGDKIRSKNNEELAEFVVYIIDLELRSGIIRSGVDLTETQMKAIKQRWFNALYDWLRQPTEVDHDPD